VIGLLVCFTDTLFCYMHSRCATIEMNAV